MSLLLVLLTRAVFVLVAVAVVCVDAATVGGGVVAVDVHVVVAGAFLVVVAVVV